MEQPTLRDTDRHLMKAKVKRNLIYLNVFRENMNISIKYIYRANTSYDYEIPIKDDIRSS